MYVPALARAHLTAESVISANKVSLGLKGVAGGQWGRTKGNATLLQRPTLCSRNTYTRVHVCERVYGRVHVHTYKLAAVASLEQGGIIRSATINPNDDDAVMTLSRTSFQATSVTLRAHLLLFSRSLHSLAVSLSLFPSPCLSPFLSRFLHLPLFVSISIIRFYLRLSFSSSSLCPHVVLSNSPTSSLPILFKLLVLTTTVYSEVGSYPVSTIAFPARFVNNSSQPLRRVAAIVSFVDIQ